EKAYVRCDGDSAALSIHQQENHFAFFCSRSAKIIRRRFGIEDKALGAVHNVAVGSLAKTRFNGLRSPVGGLIHKGWDDDHLALAQTRQQRGSLLLRSRFENHLGTKHA